LYTFAGKEGREEGRKEGRDEQMAMWYYCRDRIVSAVAHCYFR